MQLKSQHSSALVSSRHSACQFRAPHLSEQSIAKLDCFVLDCQSLALFYTFSPLGLCPQPWGLALVYTYSLYLKAVVWPSSCLSATSVDFNLKTFIEVSALLRFPQDSGLKASGLKASTAAHAGHHGASEELQHAKASTHPLAPLRLVSWPQEPAVCLTTCSLAVAGPPALPGFPLASPLATDLKVQSCRPQRLKPAVAEVQACLS